MNRIEEIAELDKRATTRRWGYDRNRHIAIIDCGDWGDTIVCLTPGIKEPAIQDKKDLEFIAHSRADIPYLLSRLQAAEEVLNILAHSGDDKHARAVALGYFEKWK